MITWLLHSSDNGIKMIISSASSIFCLLGVEIPVHQVEKESHEADEVDEDEAYEDPLRDSDKIVHGACLKC